MADLCCGAEDTRWQGRVWEEDWATKGYVRRL